MKHYLLASSLPDVCSSYILYLTLPVTSSTAEKSFSKLKLIKNYLRSTMSHLSLSGLSILYIENMRALALDLNAILNDFYCAKKRRGLEE